MAQEAIKIFRGDDTGFNGGCLLKFNISAANGTDIAGMKAVFRLAGLEFPDNDISSGSFAINLTKEQSAELPYGHIFGTLQAADIQGRIKTITNRIPFFVTDEPFGEQGGTIHLEAPGISGAYLTIAAGYVGASLPAEFWHSGYSGKTVPCPEISDASSFRIYRNGILQKPGQASDYVRDGLEITFTESLCPEDIITVEKYEPQLTGGKETGTGGNTINSGTGLSFSQFYHLQYILHDNWNYGGMIISQHSIRDVLMTGISDMDHVVSADDPFVPSIRDCLFPVKDTYPKFYKHIDSHNQTETGEYVSHSYIYGLYRIDYPGADSILIEQWGETQLKNKNENEGRITDDERPPYSPADVPSGTETEEIETVLSVSLEYQPGRCEFISANDGAGNEIKTISDLVEYVPTEWNGGRSFRAPELFPDIGSAWLGGWFEYRPDGDFYYSDGHNGDPGKLKFKRYGVVEYRIWRDYVRFNFCWENGRRLTIADLAASGIMYQQAISVGYDE